MGRYRKKPVVIEAVQWNGTVVDRVGVPPPPVELIRFAPGHISMVQVGNKTHGGMPEWLPAIATAEGTMRVSPGDWIIRGVKGEFYPCKPDIFEATYEPEGAPALIDERIR
jgi:hypothetical protein